MPLKQNRIKLSTEIRKPPFAVWGVSIYGMIVTAENSVFSSLLLSIIII